MEEGIEWNSALTAAVTMATDEGMKKDTEEISGKLRLLVGVFFPSTRVETENKESLGKGRAVPQPLGSLSAAQGPGQMELTTAAAGKGALQPWPHGWGMIPSAAVCCNEGLLCIHSKDVE